MPFDIAAVQQSLKAEGLDGWLLYDFHGSNPIAARLLGTANGSKMTTRRWFYLVPASGEPRGLVHAIERRTLDALPGEKAVYAGRQQLDAGLTKLLQRHQARGDGVLARTARFPTSRASTAEPWSSCAAAAWKWNRPATWCSASKRCGTHTHSRRIATRRRRSIG